MIARKYIGTTLQMVLCVDEIFTIHYFEYARDFIGLLEKHDFWEMVYVDCGLVDVIADDRRFPLKQGEAYFHMPNEAHNIISTSDGFSSVFIISYNITSPDAGFFNRRALMLTNFERELISMILRENARTFAGAPDIMDQTQLVRSSSALYGGEQMIKILLEQLLISLIRNASEGRAGLVSPSPKTDQYIVDSVINILTENLYGRLTLDEICRRVMFSKSYVGMRFKDRMGCGVINYYDKLKINEARRLISEGELTFTAIAEKLGFGSIHYFSRIFKAYVGMNPSEYAKSVKARGLL